MSQTIDVEITMFSPTVEVELSGFPGSDGDQGPAGPSVFVTVGTDQTDYIVDGTADNVQIQEAIDEVTDAGGGIVFLQRFTYDIVASIKMKSNVTLQGEGFGTVLRLADNAGVNVVRNNTTDSAVDSKMVLRDLSVNGNGTNQPVIPNNTGTGVDAVYFAFASKVTINNCYIYDGNRHNILISDSSNIVKVTNCTLENAKGLSNCSTFNIDDFIFSHNSSSGANETGVKIDSSQTVTISVNDVFNNSTHGIYATNGTSTTVTGNSIRGGQNGIRVTSNDYVVLSSNSIRSVSQNGIVLLQNCNYLSIVGNIIRDVGSALANTYDGINITDTGTGCSDITIIGNTIYDSTGTKMRYGIYSGNNTDYVIHGTNNIKGYVTGEVSLVGNNNRNTSFTGYSLQASGAAFSPADSTTYYFGGNFGGGPVTTAGLTRIYIPKNRRNQICLCLFQPSCGSNERTVDYKYSGK